MPNHHHRTEQTEPVTEESFVVATCCYEIATVKIVQELLSTMHGLSKIEIGDIYWPGQIAALEAFREHLGRIPPDEDRSHENIQEDAIEWAKHYVGWTDMELLPKQAVEHGS